MALTVVQIIHRLGGVATRAALLEATSRAEVDRAVRGGEIVRHGRGRYALPVVSEALRAANGLHACASHTSAAMLRGWQVKRPPDQPILTVRRNRRISADRRVGVVLKWADLSPEEDENCVTSPVRTVLDCAASLPFDEALVVADSALRHKAVTKHSLLAGAEDGPRSGRQRRRRVVELADGRAENAFESALRAIGLEVPHLCLVPQVPLEVAGRWIRPDLVDEERRLVVEADSFTWHGDRRGFVNDCWRYNALVIGGWKVLRFTWEHVMGDPDYVASSLRAVAH